MNRFISYSSSRRWLKAALASILCGGALHVQGASITVTTTADSLDAAGTATAVNLASLPGPDGQTSLREAVAAANSNPGPDTITFAVNGTFILTGATNDDNGNSGDLDVKQSLTVQGNGVSNTILDGGGIERVFDVFPSAASTFDLSNLTLQNGDTRLTAFQAGGAVYLHNNVTSTVTNCRVLNSFSGANGAVDNRGAMTMTNCVLSNNQTIPAIGSTEGGALRNSGALTLIDCTVANNTVRGEGGGVATTTSVGVTVTIRGCTFSGNTASITAGATGNGGAISTTGNQGTILITNCTLSGNRADASGGGAYFITPGAGTGNATLANVTISNNTADNDNNGTGVGGAIAINTGAVTLRNTLAAGNFNSVASVRDDINGAIVATSEYNLIGDGTGMSGITNGSQGNQVGSGPSPIAPLLGALANNGGGTETHLPLTGSPAIDTGKAAGGVSTDQRGLARVADLPAVTNAVGGDGADIGAVEVAGILSPTVTTATQTAVTHNSATLGGNVTADGGATVTARGIVWSTTANPTTANNVVPMGSGTGIFSATVNSLPSNTPIHVRAYAINSVNTSYGSDVSFTTLQAPVAVSSLTRVGNQEQNGGFVFWNITFASPVSGLSAGNFTLSGLAATGSNVASPGTSNGGLTWNVPVSTGSTDGTLTLSLANATGLTPGISTALPFAGESITMDKSPPTVVSVTRLSPGGQNTNATTVTFRLTYSEPVTLTAPLTTHYQVMPVNGSTITGTVQSVTGTGATRDVQVQITGGTGEFRLRVLD